MLKNLDWKILVPTSLILLIGIITQASNSVNDLGDIVFQGTLARHLLFIAIGIVIYFLTTKIDFSYFKYPHLNIAFYVTVILLLIATLFWGALIKGAKRWIDIVGIQFQPSELAKILVVFSTAYFFSIFKKESDWKAALFSFLAIIPPVILIFLQPHGSMAMILVVLWLGITITAFTDLARSVVLILISLLVISGIVLLFSGQIYGVVPLVFGVIASILGFFYKEHWKMPLLSFFVAAVLIGLLSPVLWNSVLQDYQKERVLVFIGLEDDERGSQFNTEQAKIAIGSGRLVGKGFGQGSQSRLDFLPEAETDFIFASYAEIFGLVGSIILVLLYGFLLFRIFSVPLSGSLSTFESLLVVGLGTKMLIEVFINLGTNLQLVPATGIPLPLMSAGGTFMITTLFSLGVIQSIINRQDTFN